LTEREAALVALRGESDATTMDLNRRLREKESEVTAIAAARDAARQAAKVLEADREVDKKPLDPTFRCSRLIER
jgi:hypothetical protein